MSKKTVSIEIRMSPEEKQALAKACSDRGETMSSYVRGLMQAGSSEDAGDNTTGDTHMARFTKSLPTRAGLATLPVLALAGFYLVSGNQAAVASTDARVAFAELDTNGDGMLSRTEYEAELNMELPDPAEIMAPLPEVCQSFEAVLTEAFDETEYELFDIMSADTNKDNLLSYTEFARVLQRERVEIFLDIDANADGVVTVAEVMADIPGEMVEHEAQELGVSTECMAALIAEEDKLLQAEFAEEAGEEISEEQAARIFIAEFDSNGDGTLTLDEVAVE